MKLLIEFTIFSAIVFIVSAGNGNNNEIGTLKNTDQIYPPFTEKEIDAIKQFRASVKPYLYQSYMMTDEYLIRWIRNSNFDLVAAKGKLLIMIQWRKDYNVDTILQEDFSFFARNCPLVIKGHDKVGRPLATMAFGKCDVRKLSISGDIDRFERYMTYLIEACAETVRSIFKSGKDIRDGILIVDVNGFNLRQHGCFRCIPSLFSFLNIYESYYPEYLHRIFIINLPRVAEPILDILLPAFSPKTKEVFKTYGFDRQEWETEIRKYIEPNQLTYQYGGTKTKGLLG